LDKVEVDHPVTDKMIAIISQRCKQNFSLG
jgi:hypothetical protein